MFIPLKWKRHRQQQKMQNAHSVLEMEQMLQNDCIFVYIHSTHKKNWQPVGTAIATHTNPFLKQ